MHLDEERLARLLSPCAGGGGPQWRRLGERIVALVDDGTLCEGVRLPTERALARRLGISRTTATAAYGHAKQTGRLTSRQGSGSFVALPPGAPRGPRGTSALFSELAAPLQQGINLSLAETPTGPHTEPLIAKLDVARLARAVGETTGYTPQGLPVLRAAIATHLGGLGQAVDPDLVVATTGAQQAIALTAQVLCPAGAAVLVEDTTFPGALEVFRRLGLRIVSVPTDDEGPVPDALDELAARLLPALAYIVPVVHNPTGRVLGQRRIEAIAAVLARHRLPVIDDRTPELLVPSEQRGPRLAEYLVAGQVVTIGSLSKVAWAGLRTGWLVTDARLGREIVAARIAAELSGSGLAQAVAAEVMPHVPELAALIRADIAASHDAFTAALASELPQWTWATPAVGPWLWVRLPSADAVRFAEEAAHRGVRVAPGPVFSTDARHGDRLRIALVREPVVMAEAVHRLRETWDTFAGSPPALAGALPAVVI